MDCDYGTILCTGLVLLALIIAVVHGHGFLMAQKIGMQSRIMMTSAIYNKVACLLGSSYMYPWLVYLCL